MNKSLTAIAIILGLSLSFSVWKEWDQRKTVAAEKAAIVHAERWKKICEFTDEHYLTFDEWTSPTTTDEQKIEKGRHRWLDGICVDDLGNQFVLVQHYESGGDEFKIYNVPDGYVSQPEPELSRPTQKPGALESRQINWHPSGKVKSPKDDF